MQITVLIKHNLQPKSLLLREAEKKMEVEISIRGNKGPSLIPMDSSKCFFLSFEELFTAYHSWHCLVSD